MLHCTQMRRAATIILFMFAQFAALSCDRDQAASTSGSASPSTTTQPQNDQTGGEGGGSRRTVMRVSTVSPLRPGRPTHFAADALGNIFWVQENDQNGAETGAIDVLYSLTAGAVPQATPLTSNSILSALKAPAGAHGSIQSIAAPPDGGVLFYFAGGAGPDVLACIGHYDSRASRINILADTTKIQSAARMGAVLALARGELIVPAAGPNDSMWLWLWHTDGAALVLFDPRVKRDSKTSFELRRPFRDVHVNNAKIVPTGETCRIAAAPGGGLMIVDWFNGTLWSVDREGRATPVWSLVGLPRQMSAPARMPDGRWMLFAADSPPIKERSLTQIAEPVIQTDYPALLMFGELEASAIPERGIRAAAGFPIYRLELTKFVPEKSGKTWLSYDDSSGELVRVEIAEEER